MTDKSHTDDAAQGSVTRAWAVLDDDGLPRADAIWTKEPGPAIKEIHERQGVKVEPVEIRVLASQPPAAPVETKGISKSLLDSALDELHAGHIALDKLGAPRETLGEQDEDLIYEMPIDERIKCIAPHARSSAGNGDADANLASPCPICISEGFRGNDCDHTVLERSRAAADSQVDELALSVALEIEQLDWGHPTQRTAGIQTVIAKALRSLVPTQPQGEMATEIQHLQDELSAWKERHDALRSNHFRAEPQTSPHPDDVVNFNGRLVTWAEINEAVRKRNAALAVSRPESK